MQIYKYTNITEYKYFKKYDFVNEWHGWEVSLETQVIPKSKKRHAFNQWT